MVDRLTPEPDRIAGNNIPYRGDVDHGVPSGRVESTDEAHYHLGRPVEFLDDPTEDIVPIPVRIVGQGARETKRVNTNIYRLDPTLNQRMPIAGRDEKRDKITVSNIGNGVGASPVFVGGENVSQVSGFMLAAGASIALITNEPLYVYATQTPFPAPPFAAQTADPVYVSVIIETSEREG